MIRKFFPYDFVNVIEDGLFFAINFFDNIIINFNNISIRPLSVMQMVHKKKTLSLAGDLHQLEEFRGSKLVMVRSYDVILNQQVDLGRGQRQKNQHEKDWSAKLPCGRK